MIRVAMLLAMLAAMTRGTQLAGTATWYDDGPGVYAAAGSEVRRFLGRGWRGELVRVCRGERCVRVRLRDICGCPGSRIIDLSPTAFARLGRLDRGVLRVTVDEPSRWR